MQTINELSLDQQMKFKLLKSQIQQVCYPVDSRIVVSALTGLLIDYIFIHSITKEKFLSMMEEAYNKYEEHYERD